MEPEKKETDPKQEPTVEKMAAQIGRMQIEALAASAGATDTGKVAEIVSKNTKTDIDATGTVKVAMVDPETGEKLRTASGEDMTPGQYIAQMKADPDHGYLFKDGAAGKPKAQPPGGISKEENPWSRDTINLGDQARLLKSDPVFAARLQAAARGTLPDNPFSKDGFNLSRQAQILRDDPAQAARMRAEVAPKENPWMRGQENLTKQVLLVRSDPTKAAILKAEAKLANGPEQPKKYITTPSTAFGGRRA